MSSPPREIVGTWEEIAAHAEEFGNPRLRITILESIPEDFPADSLEGRLMALAAEVPDEEWDKLPPGLTDRLDDHLYGPNRQL